MNPTKLAKLNAALATHTKTGKVKMLATPCRLWTGSKDKDGYGLVKIDGRSQRVVRLVLENKLGRSLRDGMDALHRCDHPPCTAPGHLYEGSAETNAEERAAKGRGKGQADAPGTFAKDKDY